MKALDTNVLERFFVDDEDDPEAAGQRPAAVAALAERAFVSVTVLLELEWVLRSARASGFATFDRRLAMRRSSGVHAAGGCRWRRWQGCIFSPNPSGSTPRDRRALRPSG